MKVISVTDIKIHCDTCYHEFHGVPNEWYCKPCPVCSAPDIITDHDMDIWTNAHKTIDFINALFGEIKQDDVVGHASITINTAQHNTAD